MNRSLGYYVVIHIDKYASMYRVMQVHGELVADHQEAYRFDTLIRAADAAESITDEQFSEIEGRLGDFCDRDSIMVRVLYCEKITQLRLHSKPKDQ
jgi:hypothetical protein